jgi:hypothetical protein
MISKSKMAAKVQMQRIKDESKLMMMEIEERKANRPEVAFKLNKLNENRKLRKRLIA